MLSRSDNSDIAGLSVFVVEDESLVALNLEDMLADLGCTVVGPAMRLARAAEMVAGGMSADVAVLDVNLAGEQVFPVAAMLCERGVPVVFTTGYDRDGLPAEWHERPILQKPYTMEEVARAIRHAVAARAG